MTKHSTYLLPSSTVAEVRAAFSDPREIVAEIRRRLRTNGQRDGDDAVTSYLCASRVVGERGRDRTGMNYDTTDDDWYNAALRAVSKEQSWPNRPDQSVEC